MGAFFLNCFAVRLLPLVDRSALLWSLLGFGVISITLLATASPNYEVKVQLLKNETTSHCLGILSRAQILSFEASRIRLGGLAKVLHGSSGCSKARSGSQVSMLYVLLSISCWGLHHIYGPDSGRSYSMLF